MRDYEEKSYYEIQLDNKQLILVFLAGVTVCVLIFVLGVMVGKGKKETEMALATRNETVPAPTQKNPEPDLKTPQEPAVAASPGTDTNTPKKDKKNKGEKPQGADTTAKKGGSDQYSFYDLDKPDSSKPDLIKKDASQPAEAAKKEATPPAAKETAPPVDTAAVASKPADTTAAPTAETPTEGRLYTVQVMATASKPKADQQLQSLKTKGYTAFLTEEKAGSSSVYKVRVGKFKDSDSAKKLAIKLKDELKLETWVAVLD